MRRLNVQIPCFWHWVGGQVCNIPQSKDKVAILHVDGPHQDLQTTGIAAHRVKGKPFLHVIK